MNQGLRLSEKGGERTLRLELPPAAGAVGAGSLSRAKPPSAATRLSRPPFVLDFTARGGNSSPGNESKKNSLPATMPNCGTGCDPVRVHLAGQVALLVFVQLVALSATAPDPHAAPGVLFIKLREDPEGAAGNGRSSTDRSRRTIERVLERHGGGTLASVCSPEAGQRAIRRLAARGNSIRVERAVGALRRLLVCRYDSDLSPAAFADLFRALPEVEYAEPRYLRYTALTPNDPLFGEPGQDFFAYHGFPTAWETSRGATEIVIAIVDSGVDESHPDLADKLWRNPGEIADNGIDDDGNGFVDDVQGWDFWQEGPIDDPVADNDPGADFSDHGTHVAGIAGAHTDNGIGVAGTGFDCSLMAVKAGGTQAEPREIGFGVEGILYAAMNGADIINCSWGSSAFSRAEEDAVNTAGELGALVVCAAGNDNQEARSYPGAHARAFAVGSVDPATGAKSGFSDFGYWVDVFATGAAIKSTVLEGGYATKSGTSMSAPVVSGLAGLLKALRPSWSPRRLAAQIRATAVTIEADNDAALRYKLGNGRIDAAAALSAPLPGVEIVEANLEGAEAGSGFLDRDVVLTLRLENLNGDAGRLMLELTPLTSGLTVARPEIEYGSLRTGQSASLSYSVHLGSGFDPAYPLAFALLKSDPTTGYRDFSPIELDSLLAGTMQAGKVRMTVTAAGTLGFVNALTGEGGIGFLPRADTDYAENLLFEGALMIDIDGVIADQARETDGLSRDFTPLSSFGITRPGTLADMQGSGRFEIAEGSGAPALTAHVESFAFESPARRGEPALDQCIFVRYRLHNPADYTLDNVYVGLFNDWDIVHPHANSVARDEDGDVLYVFDAEDDTQPYTAVIPMGDISSLFAIDNAYTGTVGELDFSIYYAEGEAGRDGFTDREKAASLRAGRQRTSRSGTDVSTVVASGPYSIPGGGDATVGFIYAYGDDLQDLLSQVAAARARRLFTVSETSAPVPRNEAPSLSIVNPAVDAAYLPSPAVHLLLQAAAEDDGRPRPGQLAIEWRQLDGPGGILFETPARPATAASFPAAGVYELEVTAGDGLKTARDRIRVVVDMAARLEAGLQAHWTFDDVRGTEVPDASAKGRDGTADGTVQIDPNGHAGSAMSFADTGSRIDFEAPDLGAFTLSAWIKPENGPNDTFPRIVDMPGHILYVGRDPAYADTAHTLRLFSNWSDAQGVWYTPPDSISDGAWQHVAATYSPDHPNAEPAFYLDGQPVPVSRLTTPRGAAPVNGGTGYIGNNADNERAWGGSIDDVRIYSRVLTPLEVGALAGSSPDNVAPSIEPGPDRAVPLGKWVSLDAVVKDDGRPDPGRQPAVEWLQLDGPGDVSLSSHTQLETEARFPEPGVYRLRVTADDGALRTAADLAITATAGRIVGFSAAESQGLEHDGQAEIGVQLDAPSTQTVSVGYRVTGGSAEGGGVDYELADGTLDFPPGTTSGTITLTIVDDDRPEDSEVIILSLVDPSEALIGRSVHAFRLIDNETSLRIDLAGAQSPSLLLGTRSGTGLGFDPGIDIKAQPPDAPGAAYVFFRNEQVADVDLRQLQTDVRAPTDPLQRWRLVVERLDNGRNVRLDWDSSTVELGPGRQLLLQRLAGERPLGAPIDMLTDHSLVVAVNGQFEISLGSETEIREFTLQAGWNLIGIPVVTTQTIAELFLPTRARAGVKTLWYWENGTYVAADVRGVLNPERAYWVHAESERTLAPVSGLAADGLVQLSAGWNAVSPVRTGPVAGTLLRRHPVWAWEGAGGRYRQIASDDLLRRLEGYWIWSPEDRAVELLQSR